MLTKVLRFGVPKICLRGAWFLSVIAVVNCDVMQPPGTFRSSRVQVDCIGRQASIPSANLDYIHRSSIDLLVV